MFNQYKAYIRIRRFDTREIVESIGLTTLGERHVERVMMGLLRNLNTEEYFVDETEVAAAREAEAKNATH